MKSVKDEVFGDIYVLICSNATNNILDNDFRKAYTMITTIEDTNLSHSIWLTIRPNKITFKQLVAAYSHLTFQNSP